MGPIASSAAAEPPAYPAIAMQAEAPVGTWTAIVLAGTRPGGDPVAKAFGLTNKAEVPMLGVPMVQWVCSTLLRSPEVARVLVLTEMPADLHGLVAAPALSDPRVTIARCEGGIAHSILAFAGSDAAPWPILVTTADHPLLTPAIIAEFLAGTADEDLTIGVVEKSVVLAAAPNARRTWLRFADGSFSGANLFAMRGEHARSALELWSRAEADRKQTWKLFLRFGPMLAVRALLRRLSFAEALRLAGVRLGLSVGLVALSDANAAIDVDKLSDHRQVEAILANGVDADAVAAPRARVGVSVFDLDRTLTRRPTYTAMLVYAAVRLAPLRLAFAPLVVLAMAGYGLKLIDRRRLKEIEHRLLLGDAVDRAAMDRITAAFAARLARDGFYPDGLARIAQDRTEGRRIVLATAANRFYVDAIARVLQVRPDEIVATGSSWSEAGLTSRIDGANCYGATKRDMIDAHLAREGMNRSDVYLRFFTDHISDRATLDWSDEPIAVNPSGRLRRLARSRGWTVLDWR